MKILVKKLFGRIGICLVLITLQAIIFVATLTFFHNYAGYVYFLFLFLSFVAVTVILNNRLNPSYKIAWIIPIMLFPIFGGIFYFLFSSDQTRKKFLEEMKPINEQMRKYLIQDEKIIKDIRALDIRAANQAHYINRYAFCPIYEHTTSEYFKLGEDKFERLLEELRKAQHYIFLEYFIIGQGKMWDAVLEILKEKAAIGVDVRVIYDDLGCLLLLPDDYPRILESMGIKCCVFNPVKPFFSFRMNNRNHRKIIVVDGYTAFNGGINLADEYINHFEKHGHWKDTALMIQGEAVWSFTVMFLTMWNYLRKTDESFESFRPHIYHKEEFADDGFVQPFADSPIDREYVGETVYLNLINNAKDYIYITSPYLILDSEMIDALSNAAKRGVDVRILTPFKADKWYVHAITRSNYRFLIEDGVKIFEYTPGFIHSKMFVVDDEYTVIGTINLDYRSLYLHYECATWMYKTKIVFEIKEDILESLAVSEEITLANYNQSPWYARLLFVFLRIFAPLM